MSFPSLNNTSDYDVYTTKYLQSLALQIQLNQNNFDKNVGFMKTGVQDTERPDSRSIEERAGDVEKLKVQARVMLNKISDATNTNEVLDYLVKNGELLFFFIQQFPAIEKLVKEQYAGGVRAPILISLIYKRFISQQEDSLMPESADFDIVSKMMTRLDAEVLLNQTNNPELRDKLIDLARVLPSRQEIKTLLENPAGNKDEIKFVAEMFKNSPSVSDYNSLTEEYNDAPLKDDLTNYDLEEAEDKMIQIITSFLIERRAFQENTTNQKRMLQIDRTNFKRKTKPLPVAKDTRIARTSEQQRATTKGRRQTVEDIDRNLQFIQLNPTNTKISEVSPAEQYMAEKLFKDIKEPRLVSTMSRKSKKSKTQDDIFSNDLLIPTIGTIPTIPTLPKENNKPIYKDIPIPKKIYMRRDKELLESVNKFENIKQGKGDRDMGIDDRESMAFQKKRQPTQREINADLEEEIQRFEMRKMGKSDTRTSERKQEAKQREKQELNRIMNEMEQLKREKKQEEEKQKAIEDEIRSKEETLKKKQVIQEKQAGSKITTFLKKKIEKGKKEILVIENEIAELEKQDDAVISKQESIQAKQQELEVKKKAGRPKGSKDINPRIRTPKAVIQAERMPEAPTNTPIIIPRAPTNTPVFSEKVPVPTGKGLLNKQEQLSHRFKVLKGEILAGNTASQVIKEMRSLVKQLVNTGELSKEQHDGILKELKTL